MSGTRSHPILRFLGGRLLAALVTLFVASVLIFAGTELLPGDAASAVLGRNATPETLAELRAQLGLDQPALQRYLDWLGGLVHRRSGRLGGRLRGRGGARARSGTQIREPISNSLILAAHHGAAAGAALALLGVIAAVCARRGRSTTRSRSASLAAIALPEFVIGSLLVGVFFVWLDLLPPVALVRAGREPARRTRRSSCCRC